MPRGLRLAACTVGVHRCSHRKGGTATLQRCGRQVSPSYRGTLGIKRLAETTCDSMGIMGPVWHIHCLNHSVASTTKLAVAVWQGRISPLLDTASQLLLVDLGEQGEVSRSQIGLGESSPYARAERLAALGVDVLVCGAISRPLLDMMAARGIHVLPWTAGEASDVLSAFCAGVLPDPRFTMPGCRCPSPGHRRRRRAQGRPR